MGKAASCIRMLQILNTGRIYKVSELAELLETNPRNIIEYKKELDEVAAESGFLFYIETIPGRYGGYKLNTSIVLPSIRLGKDEKEALSDVLNYAMSKKDFVNKNGLIKTMSKLFSALLIENSTPSGIVSVDKVNSLINESTIEDNYNKINAAIKNKTTLVVKYRWLKEPTSYITIDPYQLFLYDNEWRFFAWVHERINDGDPICYLKLSRIEEIKITEKKFRVYKYFKAEQYLSKNVFSQNGEMFKVKLIAHGIRAKLIKEKQIGYNQVVEDLDDGSIAVTLEMQKNPSTYNTILGFGDLVEVVEPQWLKEKIKELTINIFNKYK